MSSSLAAAVLLALASAAAPPAVAEVRSVTVTVTDAKGQPIQSLEPQEVAVVENGNTRTLGRVEKDRRPLKLAVIVDTSEPMADDYRLQVVEPVLRFLARLPEGAQYAVWTTGDRPTKVVDYGDGPAAAAKALRRVYPTGGNTLLDALVEASHDLESKEAARAAIVVVTGTGIGFTNYSKEQVVDVVRKAGPSVLAAQVEEAGRSAPGSRGAGEVSASDYDYVLGNAAQATGGRREILLSAMGTGRLLDIFAAELSSQYRISYDTDAAIKDSDRKVEVKVARPGAHVRVGTPRP